MSLIIKAVSITSLKVDVIVNSLGVDILTYGKICSSIVKDAKSEKLVSFINKLNGKVKPGEIYYSPAYNLKCKKIAHIITPYFVHDEELFALEYVYKKVLTEVKEKGYKSIALPVIGTGANGYPHSYAISLETHLLKQFSEQNEDMDIYLCMPVVEKEEYNAKFSNPEEMEDKIREYFKENTLSYMRDFSNYIFDFNNLNRDDVECFLGYKNRDIETKAIDKCNCLVMKCFIDGTRRHIDSKFLAIEENIMDLGIRPVKVQVTKNITSIGAYIEEYIDIRFKDKKMIKEVKHRLDRALSGTSESNSLRSKHYDSKKRRTLPITMLMRYIIGLHMTREEANDFLYFCGRVLNTYFISDCVYDSLIGNYDDITVNKINGLCMEMKIDPIFGYSDTKDKCGLYDDEKL